MIAVGLPLLLSLIEFVLVF